MSYRDESGDSFWNEMGGQRPTPVPNGGRLLAQHWRCPSCQKIIYAWDKTVPCDAHRVVTEWQEYYQSARFATDTAAAREQAAHGRPRRDESKLREMAARQVSEARAAREDDFPGGLPLPAEYPGNARSGA
jgi:hypothetical protein